MITQREPADCELPAPEAAATASAAPLGNNADFIPTPSPAAPVLLPPSTVKAWYLRSLGRDILKKHGVERRMRWCGSRIAPKERGVDVFARPDRAYGRVAGVCVCGQSICCPVCAPRIAAFRAAEIGEAFKRARDAGFDARLETFTKPHALDTRPNALTVEIGRFRDLWKKYMKHADRRERGTEGHHLGREVNFGQRNGWHYHHHRLRYDRPDSFDQERARAQWLAVLDGAGLWSPGAEIHAYDCGDVDDEAGAKYCAKLALNVDAQARSIGSELASAGTKGRSINMLLGDYARGDLNAGVTWLNGVSCVTAGKVSSVRWSKGLRWKLGMSEEKSDEQIAAEEVVESDVYLGALNAHQWRGVLKWRAEFCLCVAANKGRDAVNEFLSGLELGELKDDLPEPVFSKKRGR